MTVDGLILTPLNLGGSDCQLHCLLRIKMPSWPTSAKGADLADIRMPL